MRKQHLLKKLRRAAREQSVELRLLRQGKHEVWSFGGERLVIPRHAEIDEYTAIAILLQVHKSTRRGTP